jgi:uncharacterized protein
LVGDSFVARMDSKADRKEGVLIVHNLHFEPVKLSRQMIAGLTDAIKKFARFNQCQDIILKKSNQAQYLKAIKAGLGRQGPHFSK